MWILAFLSFYPHVSYLPLTCPNSPLLQIPSQTLQRCPWELTFNNEILQLQDLHPVFPVLMETAPSRWGPPPLQSSQVQGGHAFPSQGSQPQRGRVCVLPVTLRLMPFTSLLRALSCQPLGHHTPTHDDLEYLGFILQFENLSCFVFHCL